MGIRQEIGCLSISGTHLILEEDHSTTVPLESSQSDLDASS